MKDMRELVLCVERLGYAVKNSTGAFPTCVVATFRALRGHVASLRRDPATLLVHPEDLLRVCIDAEVTILSDGMTLLGMPVYWEPATPASSPSGAGA